LSEQLNRFLLEQRRAGRRVLLIIDEAQTLPPQTLEEIRLLSNLETSTSKLLQILLFGQPELDAKLESRELRQLRQRISVRWALQALDPTETREYVRHRIRTASGAHGELFSEGALREVHRRSGGIPRLVNLI
jgi:general secretion pathway protein A